MKSEMGKCGKKEVSGESQCFGLRSGDPGELRAGAASG